MTLDRDLAVSEAAQSLKSEPGQYLTTKEVAVLLQVSTRTLEGWRHNGKGPAYAELEDRIIRYRSTDIEDWVASRVTRGTQ